MPQRPRQHLTLVLVLTLIGVLQSCAKVDVDKQTAATNESLGVPISPPPEDCDHDGLNDSDEVLHGTDPANPDTDSDGLNDGDEVQVYGSNPHMNDTDSDGLTDGAEVNTFHTSPTLADTDAGGMRDGDEVSKGRNPLLDTDDASFPSVYTCN